MNKWDKREYELTLELYSKLRKEGKAMHVKNPDVIALSREIGRSTNSIAMRLQNFEYYATGGDKGLSNGSKMCESVYDELCEKFGLPEPSCKSEDSTKQPSRIKSPAVSLSTMAIINDIIVSIAMAVNNMKLVKSESVDLFASLTTIMKYIHSDTFVLEDLELLSDAVKSIPNYPNNLLSSTLQAHLSEVQYRKIITLINIFK